MSADHHDQMGEDGGDDEGILVRKELDRDLEDGDLWWEKTEDGNVVMDARIKLGSSGEMPDITLRHPPDVVMLSTYTAYEALHFIASWNGK